MTLARPHRFGASPGERMLCAFLGQLFTCPKPLGREIWRAMYDSEKQSLTWQLSRVSEVMSDQTVENLQKAMPPGRLLELTARVAPENGQVRPVEVRALEEAVLKMAVDPETWR